MATDIQKKADDLKQASANLLRTAVGVSPLIAAAYYGGLHTVRNTAINTPVARSTPIKQLEKTLGQRASALDSEQKAFAVGNAEKIKASITKDLSSVESLSELFKTVEHRNSLLQALSVTLDDPSLAIDENVRSTLKTQLQGAAEIGVTDHTRIIEDISKVMHTIATSSNDTVVRFEQARRRFGEVGAQLRPAMQNIPSKGTAYNTLPTSLPKGSNKERYVSRIQKALSGLDYSVETTSYKEVTGEVVNVAQIFQNYSGKKVYRASVPLGGRFYRTGETGRTLYTMPVGFIDLAKANTMPANAPLGRAYVPTPEHFIDDIEKRARSGAINWGDVRHFQSTFLTNVDRIAGRSDAYGSHVLNQAQRHAQRLGVLNIDRVSQGDRAKAYAQLVTRNKDKLDAGIGAKTMMYRNGNTIMGNVGKKKDSLFDLFQSVYGSSTIDRSSMPLVAREHQLTGRAGAFRGGFSNIGNTGLVQGSIMEAAYARGGNFGAAVHDITGFGSHFSGARGSVMVYDVGGRLTEGGLGGEGMSFIGRKSETQRPLNLTVMDPGGHGYLGSDVYNRAITAGESGIAIGKEELRTGSYLGETSSGSKVLPFNESIESINLRLSEATSTTVGCGVKKETSFAGSKLASEDFVKAFSVTAKTMMQTVDDQFAGEARDVLDPLERAFKSLGVDRASVWHGDGSQLSKGTANMIYQITHGAVLVGGGNVTLKNLNTAASAIEGGSNKPVIGVFSSLPNEQRLGQYVQAAMTAMHGAGVSPEHMGLVLNAVYHGPKGGGSGYQGEIEQLARTFYKTPEQWNAFRTVLDTKKAIGFDYLNLGESAWGRGRMGVEPRYAKALQERLMHDVGMSMNDSAGVVSSIMKNKVGYAAHYNVARDLTHMMDYTHGLQGPATFANEKATRLNYKGLFEKGFLGQEENTFASYLKTQDHGVVVDFGDAPEAMRRTLEKVFGKAELYFPGKETFEHSKGTTLKLAEGAQSLEGPLGKLINSFQGSLLRNQSDPKNLETSMRSWKGNVTEMFSSAFHQLSAGKIKGGTAPIMAGLDITNGVGFANTKQLTRARELAMKSKTAVAFQDTEGFLSQMLDVKGTESSRDSAIRMQRYFTSMEHGAKGKSYLGINSIIGRDPQLGPGNVQLFQTFRDLSEVSTLGGEDKFFQRFKGSNIGRELLKEHFGTQIPQSFADSRFRSRKAHGFFQGMMENLDKFTSGEDHGRLTTLNMKVNGKMVGPWTQAVGDMDGDHGTHVFLDGPNANKINQALRGSRDAASAREFRGRLMYNEIADTAKDALGHMANRMGKIKGSAFEIANAQAEQDIQKEIGLSMNTGPLDVSMRRIHEAVLQHETDPMSKSFNRQLLAGIQEHFVIKSKKLEKFTSAPERITNAFSKWGTEGSDESYQEVRSIMTEIFGETKFAKEGITIQAPTMTGDPEMVSLWNKHMSGQNMEATFTMEDFLTKTHASVKTSVAAGTNKGLTEGSLSKMFENSPQEAMDYVKSHGGLGEFLPQGETMGARTESAFDSIRQGMSKMDAHMTGKLALGAVASAALFGMMNNGVSPEPIVMPGERTNSRVMGEISSGNLFNRADPQVSPAGSIAPSDQYANMVPINTGTTYATRPNSYQIRGEVSSGSGLSNFGSYFNQLTGGTGRGVITINDQRRPITRNYVDRMLGEY